MYKRNYLNCLIIFNLRFFRYQYFKVDIKKKLSQQAVYVLPGLTKSEFFHWQTRLRLYQNISLGIAPGYNFTVNIWYRKFITQFHYIQPLRGPLKLCKPDWLKQHVSVWDLLGMCSSQCLGSTVTAGLLIDPATPPLFRSPLDTDVVMVRMQFPRWTGDSKFVVLLFWQGDGVWLEDSWLAMLLSSWSDFLSAAASGICSLAVEERYSGVKKCLPFLISPFFVCLSH